MPELSPPGVERPEVHTVLISPQFPHVLRDLRALGLNVMETEGHPALPAPVRYHADLVCFPLGGTRVLLASGSPRLERALAARGFTVLHPAAPLGGTYPDDIPLCAARVGRHLLCRRSSTDPAVLASVDPACILDVRQGYARCSTLAVDERSLITADPSIARAAGRAGLDVLCIQPGSIRLDGYDTGFIGGCAVRLASDLIYLTGALRHSDAARIRQFAALRGVTLLEGGAPELIDVGAGVPLYDAP